MAPIARSTATILLCSILSAVGAALAVRSTASAEEDADRVPTDIAVCDVLGLTEEVFSSERFLKPRQDFEESLWPADLKAKRREVQELEKKLTDMDENSPDYEDTYAKWDTLSDAVWQKENEITDQVSLMELRDRTRAFSLVIAAAADVAEDSGHRYVAMGGAPKPVPADAEADVLKEALRNRVFLVMPIFPAKADITDDVRFELGLK